MCIDQINLGLTNQICQSLPTNEFYATYIGGNSDMSQCGNGNDYSNGVFGCGSSSTEWISQSNTCGVLDILDSNGIYGNASNYGWDLMNNEINDELWYITHTLVGGSTLYGGMVFTYLK